MNKSTSFLAAVCVAALSCPSCTSVAGNLVERQLKVGQAYDSVLSVLSVGARDIVAERLNGNGSVDLKGRGLDEEGVGLLKQEFGVVENQDNYWVVVRRYYGVLGLGCDVFYLLFGADGKLLAHSSWHVN